MNKNDYDKKWRLENPEKVKAYNKKAVTDYSKGKIYKIVCNITGDIYIGSTKEKYLSRRLQRHKYHYKDFLKGKGEKVASFSILEKDNFEIILIETYPCDSKYELESRERYWIENTKCLNINIPTRTRKEKREAEPEITKEKDKIMYEKRAHLGKVKILCECGALISKNCMSKHKKRDIHLNNL
tara:strand:+ start:2637 stop:3188 length:552 start_codon:yes stop_codon:yes gene_type:complete